MFVAILISFLSLLNANLISPSDKDSLYSIYGLFEWNQEPNAVEYNLQVSTNEMFDHIILDTISSKLMYLENERLDWGNMYYWRVSSIFEDEDVGDWIDTFSFHTGFTKNNPDDVLVEIIDEDKIQDGFIIYGSGKGKYSIMYDNFGKEVWNDGILNTKLLHIDKFGRMYSSGLYSDSLHRNIALKFNSHHDALWQGLDPSEPPYGMNAHDLKELPNGNFLYTRDYNLWGPIPLGPWTDLFQQLGYIADGETIEFLWQSTRLYEIDRNNHEILMEWDATDYFSMDVYDSIGNNWNWSLNNGLLFDWIHNNSIWYDEIEDAVYLSSRSLSRITKIDYSSGDIIWMIGLPNEYVPSDFDDHICTELLFSYQHHAQILDNGHLLFFDNGNLSQIVRGTEYKTTRILEVDVLDDNTCDVIWEYDLSQDLYASSRGSVMKLDNGNYLINIATETGDIIEVTPDKEIVWRLYLNNSGDNAYENYRAFRVPSLYPDAFSVIFDDYEIINLSDVRWDYSNGSISDGIILKSNVITLSVTNLSGYEQLYSYDLSD